MPGPRLSSKAGTRQTKAGDLATPVSPAADGWTGDTVAGQRRHLTGFAINSCAPAARCPREGASWRPPSRIRLWR